MWTTSGETNLPQGRKKKANDKLILTSKEMRFNRTTKKYD